MRQTQGGFEGLPDGPAESLAAVARFAVTNPADDAKVLWVVATNTGEQTGSRAGAVPLREKYSIYDGELPPALSSGLQEAGPGHVVVEVPLADFRGASLDALGPGYLWRPPRPKDSYERENDPFHSLLSFVRHEELPDWRELGPDRQPKWRLPSTSGEFWAKAEFARDIHEFGEQLRWTVGEINRFVSDEQQRNSNSQEPQWLTENQALQWLRDHIVDLTIANAYRMAENLGCEDLPDRKGLPARSRQKVGREPHEQREPGPQRDALSRKWNRDWPNFIADDTTVGFLNECRAALELLVPSEREAFLGLRVRGLDGRERSMATCIGRAWGYVYTRQLLPGDGVIFTQRDGNDCWQVWDDSPRSKQFRDGTMPDEPIAPIELQARTYDMLVGFVDLLENSGVEALKESMNPAVLAACADQLKARAKAYVINDDTGSWLANAITKGDSPRQLDVAGVNMGLVLNTRLVERMHPQLVVSLIGKLAEISGPYGVPTMDNSAVGAQPGGYHNGSTWSWTNADIVRGLSGLRLPKTALTLSTAAMGDMALSLEAIGTDGVRSSTVGTFWTQCVFGSGERRRVSRAAHQLDPFEEVNQAWTVGARMQHYVISKTLSLGVSATRQEQGLSDDEQMDERLAERFATVIAARRAELGIPAAGLMQLCHSDAGDGLGLVVGE